MAKCTQQSFFNLEKYTLVKVVKMVVFLRIQHQLDMAWDIWEDRSEECSVPRDMKPEKFLMCVFAHSTLHGVPSVGISNREISQKVCTRIKSNKYPLASNYGISYENK